MPYKNSRLSDYLEHSELMLKNARKDTTIRDLLAVHKIDDVKITEGLTLCENAYTLEKLQVKLHGEQFRARAIFEKLRDETHPRYMDHVKFMRMAHRDDLRKLDELDAATTRVRTITGWLTQSKTFYTNVLGDEQALAKMTGYGITAENLQEVELKVAEVGAANQEHKLKKGEAQDAIDRRDAALDLLDKFMSEFIGICRIALKEHPQLLEKLGIVVYTKGYISAKSKAAAEERKKLKKQKKQKQPESQGFQDTPETTEPPQTTVSQEVPGAAVPVETQE